MKIEGLRNIGKKLLKEISLIRRGPLSKIAIGVGASGDKTYPIDERADEVIISSLEKSGESLTILSEESGIKEIKGGGKRVLIDPIDGSKNAISGIPFYSTSIAVADGDTIGDVELAYVVNLINGDEFWAEKGEGAFLNGEKIFTQKDDEFYLIAYEAQSPHKDIQRIMPLIAESKKIRCFGSTALDLAYLAHGAISIFVSPSFSRSFDFAGGWLLVQEAGGIFTDIQGDSIEVQKISLKRGASLLVSGNKRLHEKALKLLSRTQRLI